MREAAKIEAKQKALAARANLRSQWRCFCWSSGSVGWVTVKGNAGTAAWPAESNRATAAKGNEVTR